MADDDDYMSRMGAMGGGAGGMGGDGGFGGIDFSKLGGAGGMPDFGGEDDEGDEEEEEDDDHRDRAYRQIHVCEHCVLECAFSRGTRLRTEEPAPLATSRKGTTNGRAKHRCERPYLSESIWEVRRGFGRRMGEGRQARGADGLGERYILHQ